MIEEGKTKPSKSIVHENEDVKNIGDHYKHDKQFDKYLSNEMATKSKDYQPTKEKVSYSNQHHPSLEYPLLYHILNRFPQHMELYKSLHERRWKMSYRLQRYIPDLRYFQSNGKIRYTYAEAILLCPFIFLVAASIVYSFIFPSTHMSGKVSRYSIILALVFAQRNSYLTLVIGMAVDRAHTYHKIAGYVAFITGIFHTYSYFVDDHNLLGPFEGSVNKSGVGILVLLTTMVVTASPVIRRNLFELFYYVHIFCLVCITGCTFYHSGITVPIIVMCIWGVDLFIRSFIMARCVYPNNASIRTISDSVTELSFPKSHNFCYNPGQYVYLAIPEISSLQWHPFSIATAPSVDGEHVKFYIRRTGDWTSALFDLAKVKSKVYILMEGPYGSLSVDLLKDRKYKNVMLVSGGIGGKFFSLLFL
jgi:predicted ferric reductase